MSGQKIIDGLHEAIAYARGEPAAWLIVYGDGRAELYRGPGKPVEAFDLHDDATQEINRLRARKGDAGT